MVSGSWRKRGFIVSLLISLFFASFFIADEKVGGSVAYARQRRGPVLCWDSRKSRERAKKWAHLRKSDRRLVVSKENIVRLKRSSFFNRKPFQFSTPIINDNKLYVGVDAGFFYAVDLNKYKKLWRYETSGSVHAKAAVDNGIVFFGDIDGYAYALNAGDGSEIWKVFLGASILSAPLVDSDQIYFATDSSRLFALNKKDGSELWHTESLGKDLGFSVMKGSNPISHKGKIVFGNARGMLLIFDTNGDMVWTRQLGDRNELVYDIDSQPLVQDKCMYVSTADRKLFCIDPEDYGREGWVVNDVGGVNDLLVAEGSLFVTGDGVLAAVTPLNGQLLWEQDFELPEISSPAFGADVVAVVSTTGKFFLVDPLNGDVLFGRYVRGGSFSDPVFAGDNLIILSNSGKLYSFRVKEKPVKKKTGK